MSEGATTGRIPPQNLEAEQSVLGGIILKGEVLDRVAELVSPEDFYKETHRVLFRTMLSLHTEGEKIDLITVSDRLRETGELDRVGGVEFLTSLSERVLNLTNIEHHARIIREKAFYRTLIDEASALIEKAFQGEEDVEQFMLTSMKNLNELGNQKNAKKVQRIDEVLRTTFSYIDERYKHKQPFTGLPTGFTDFDRLTAGLQNSDLIILAARPGMGKTAFALNIAAHVALVQRQPVLFFSCEMSSRQLALRVIAREGRIDAKNVKTGQLSEREYQQLIDTIGRISDGKLFIDDTGGIKLSELVLRSRRQKRESGLALIVIDYLQLVRLDPYLKRSINNREQEIAEISRTLKELAKELDAPVIALSQLNRELEKRGAKEKRPKLSDLRESGALEQDADLIAFLHRESYFDKELDDQTGAELLIEKHRNGALDKVQLRFFGQFTRYESYSDDRYQA